MLKGERQASHGSLRWAFPGRSARRAGCRSDQDKCNLQPADPRKWAGHDEALRRTWWRPSRALVPMLSTMRNLSSFAQRLCSRLRRPLSS